MIDGSPDDQAMQAWMLIEEAHRRAGYWTSVFFDDGAIGSAIVIVFGGWPQLSEALHPVFDRETGRQVAGLTPEMRASKRNEFFAAFRTAKRTRTSRPYLPGRCEIENRNTIAQWSRGQGELDDQGREILRQHVCVASGVTARLVEARFDRSTGELTDDPRTLLQQQPPARARVRAAAKPKLLPAAATATEPVPPAETQLIRQAVKTLGGGMRIDSPLTEHEYTARLEKLRLQVDAMRHAGRRQSTEAPEAA
jgi:hypothetical protein